MRFFNHRKWEDGLTWYGAFNYAEGMLWLLIGAFVAFKCRQHSGRKRLALAVAGAVFGLFGISDWVEAPRERAIPVWLAAWKILCGAGLLACRFTYLGWREFHWKRPELWFGLFLLAAFLAALGTA